jgi:iron complex transport system ATP-binding protein
MTTLSLDALNIIRGHKVLIRDLSLTIQPGDFWGILGPNGCGKTTLAHTLCGQIPPHSGQLQLNERALHTLSTRDIAQQIGILFQDTRHAFPQTVREYCQDASFPHRSLFSTQSSPSAPVNETLNALTLTAHADKNIQQLSGGEQQRAAIAALLVQSPTYFVLDEPTNHLDLHHQIQVMNIFAEKSAAQHAVIAALHDINLAASYCNHILMIFADGSVLHGTKQEMLTPERLSHLYQHPIDVIREGGQTYWLPQRIISNKKESVWESVY